MEHYILGEDGEPEAVDLMTWAVWFEGHQNRVIFQDYPATGVLVSTVFLGIDHSFGSGAPVLWETMIFGRPFDQNYQERYRSKLHALVGHVHAVLFVEFYYSLPRRLKKAMMKNVSPSIRTGYGKRRRPRHWRAGHFRSRTLRPVEARRYDRAFARFIRRQPEHDHDDE